MLKIRKSCRISNCFRSNVCYKNNAIKHNNIVIILIYYNKLYCVTVNGNEFRVQYVFAEQNIAVKY